jgi:hypothetical protein
VGGGELFVSWGFCLSSLDFTRFGCGEGEKEECPDGMGWNAGVLGGETWEVLKEWGGIGGRGKTDFESARSRVGWRVSVALGVSDDFLDLSALLLLRR